MNLHSQLQTLLLLVGSADTKYVLKISTFAHIFGSDQPHDITSDEVKGLKTLEGQHHVIPLISWQVLQELGYVILVLPYFSSPVSVPKSY